VFLRAAAGELEASLVQKSKVTWYNHSARSTNLANPWRRNIQQICSALACGSNMRRTASHDDAEKTNIDVQASGDIREFALRSLRS